MYSRDCRPIRPSLRSSKILLRCTCLSIYFGDIIDCTLNCDWIRSTIIPRHSIRPTRTSFVRLLLSPAYSRRVRPVRASMALRWASAPRWLGSFGGIYIELSWQWQQPHDFSPFPQSLATTVSYSTLRVVIPSSIFFLPWT